MGSRSAASTSANQQTTNVQDIDTTTIGLEDVETGIVGNTGPVTVLTSDHGAIEAGTRLGLQSLDFAGEFGSDALKRAFDFGGNALGTIENGLSAALDFASDANDATVSHLGRAIESAGSATRSDASAAVKDIGKYAVIGLGIMAAAFVAYYLLRK